MLSYVLSFFNNLFSKEPEEDDYSKESFLADQLLDIESLKEELKDDTEPESLEIPRNVACFQRTGLITYTGDNNYVLIDGSLYFDITLSPLTFSVNDKILYLGYQDDNETIKVVRVLENYGPFWGDSMDMEEDKFKVIEHVIIGEVGYREERLVFLKDNDLKFSLDEVEATFIPMKGDWLELICTVQYQDDKPADISAAQVLKVLSFKPLRSKVKSTVVTSWDGESGTCDRQFFFNRQSVQNGSMPQVGAKVMVEAIESNQGACTWRVTKMMIIEGSPVHQNKNNDNNKSPEENITLELEKEKRISVTYPLVFENVDFHQSENMNLVITNNSDQSYFLNKWIMLSKKRDSQIEVKPFLTRPMKVYPGRTVSFSITCYPKLLGSSKECLIFMFNGFQVKRFININVVDNNMKQINNNAYMNDSGFKSEQEKINGMKDVRRNKDRGFIPGVKLVKAPNFVPVRLGSFPIPDKVWAAVLGNSEQTVYGNDYDKVVDRIEMSLPCLCQELNITNYLDRWHTLLFMEEIQANICMRVYDMPKVYLIHCQEYLGIEIKGLCERRPSLIKGDRVIVKDTWSSSHFEGYVHVVRGDLVLLKFNPQFHEIYSGSDVSVEFHFNRSTYRRAHQALNLAISNLGPDILFPSRLVTRSQQVSPHDIGNIKWFNKLLNPGQKAAVTNILLGECRPMPYCIYGPPGTGKTITVIETILQIISVIPDSRILVATPSNSAANLITERLIQYRDRFSGSMIRLIANYLLDSENLPDVIKPFCATLDIAREETSKPNYQVRKDGVNLNCQTSFIGRHRVTIGTCFCIGTLAQMGLPRGHFTHVVVDEAGQATEPEIMIPLTFTDKDNGQIILAGDPQQLGPVILSKYCMEFNMNESYLSRILETFPYQRDFEAYEDGFNKKLVTKLKYNYRSLEEVLKLPSQMFYDASLVPKMSREEAWISDTINTVSEVFDSSERTEGGVFVYGIKGVNARAEDSPSWFNREEAAMVALMTCKLYKRNITPDDIGIITPYIAQTKYFRVLFESMGLPQPKIGTVEEFQGQERKIILISTVRSTEAYLVDDRKHALGFVQNPKRLNVALTRAQIAVILFCNPHLLCKDPLWGIVVRKAVKEDKYKGCDLPYDLETVNTDIIV
ncbi:probable RNA helicase armi [Cydia pomonella]|uniref:probable RNA helicase armi n=1 Tax=Cydia pomonella TaxID=82600 RepID=UPI002ADD4680|nr:probable RNA helicase armi [Cydia pomonella]